MNSSFSFAQLKAIVVHLFIIDNIYYYVNFELHLFIYLTALLKQKIRLTDYYFIPSTSEKQTHMLTVNLLLNKLNRNK